MTGVQLFSFLIYFIFDIINNKSVRNLRKIVIFGIFSQKMAIFCGKFFILWRNFLARGDRGGDFPDFGLGGGHEVN